jgi:ribosomal protein L37AE/L43A
MSERASEPSAAAGPGSAAQRGRGGAGMSERAVPFYCPYCGEEDLRPAEQTERVPHGAWYCGSCLRTFAVKMIGIGVPEVSR